MPTPAQIATLTLIADGDGFIVGSPATAEYVEVPELGARIVEWLQQGLDAPEVERRAAALAGEPVDVADFLQVLADEGLFADEPESGAAPLRAGAALQRIGRLLFSRAAWVAYAAAVLVGPALLIMAPQLRPSYRDGFPFTSQLFNIVAVSLLGMAAVAIHEGAHVLAAAALGLRSRLSVSRRLYFLTFQADLTRLWSVPRRARYGPLLAGMAWDMLVLTVALVLESVLADRLGPVAVRLLRALVLLQFTAIIAQTMVFVRTDVYALLVNVTGCRTLWATKGALLRRYLRRATEADREQLEAADASEVTWARRYLWLYVPGTLVALGYLVYFALPSLPHLIGLCLAPIRADGLTTVAAWQGAAALLVSVVPTLFALVGGIRGGVRVVRNALRRRRATVPARAEAPVGA